VKVNGTQHLLASGPEDFPSGPTYIAALDAFRKLMESGNLDTAGDSNTVRAVLDAYLQAAETVLRPNTFKVRLKACRLFASRYGELQVNAVKPYHAESVIAEMQQERQLPGRSVKWSHGTARLFTVSLKTAFNWATKAELLTRNPLAKMKLGTDRTASRERTLTPGDFKTILTALTLPRQQYLRRLLIALENTGARPGELTAATVADWYDTIGAIVYYRDDARRDDEHRHKTARLTDRVIYFSGEALTMVRTLLQGKKAGELLFPNSNGNAYGNVLLSNCVGRLRERTGLKHLVPYSFRHTYATDWILKGGNIDVLATLLGNSAATIRKHYSHLLGRHDDMRQQIRAIRGT